MKNQIYVFFVLLFCSTSIGQTMENSIFYGTCQNEYAGWMELDDTGEVIPMYPSFILDRESFVSICGNLPQMYVELPNVSVDPYLPYFDRPMFEYREGRRYLVIFGKKGKRLQYQNLPIPYDWQFGDYEVHIHDLDESPRELEYRRKIESCCTDHIKISSLKKVQEKVHFWKSAMDRRTVSFSEFIKDMGKPFRIFFDEKEGTAVLLFSYYCDIENRNEVLIQTEDERYPELLLPQIIATEKNGVIIEVEERRINIDTSPILEEDCNENIILGPIADPSLEMEEEDTL